MMDQARMAPISRNGPTIKVTGFPGRAQRLCALLVASLTVSSAGCVKTLSPTPIPASTIPAGVNASPPAPGAGRLIVDVENGPTEVARVAMRATPLDNGTRRTFRFAEAFEPLCPQSPCTTETGAGTNVLLGFPVLGDSNETEVELVHVGPETSIYRRSLSTYTKHSGGGRVLAIIATSLGGAALVTGTTLLPQSSDSVQMAGAICLGSGAVLATLGILGIVWTRDTYQPGSSNHFAPGQ